LELQRILASWAAEVYRSRDQYRHNFQLRDVTVQLRHTVLQLLQKTKSRCLLDRVFSAWKQDSSTCVSQHRMSWQWALTLQRCELKRLLHCWLLIAKSLVNETKYHCEVDNLRAKSQHVWHLAYLHKSLVICSSVVSAWKHVALFCTKKLGDIRKALHTWINSSLDLELRSIVRCWAAAVDSSKALRHHYAQVQRLETTWDNIDAHILGRGNVLLTLHPAFTKWRQQITLSRERDAEREKMLRAQTSGIRQSMLHSIVQSWAKMTSSSTQQRSFTSKLCDLQVQAESMMLKILGRSEVQNAVSLCFNAWMSHARSHSKAQAEKMKVLKLWTNNMKQLGIRSVILGWALLTRAGRQKRRRYNEVYSVKARAEVIALELLKNKATKEFWVACY